mmetsp:Transcript_83631/g.132192  ORF Transcript_83631/g.132192 Transcript_83631/m.132192 type:complete len:199 (+) Transcript_83631:69-665(+)|eukprot:CAMPEP_0169101642 /NCGR_PEP_ID=MMETSP1015-20121227/21742_1 /TAXON_ID=342587 /ORGANISM="Karlodinium micrum, Strain CCMP2283" /LENGTH=198 /DNA_ID=CAMNT_0009162689 /DNA_START=43 /DNA_END=639 /DNA_ORIENTATION=-
MDAVDLTIVSALSGAVLTRLRADESWTVHRIRQAIGLSARFLYDGEAVSEGQTLTDIGIPSGATLQYVRVHGIEGVFECLLGRLGRARIELKGDGSCNIEALYQGGYSSPMTPWKLQLMCSQSHQPGTQEVDIMIEDVTLCQGSPASPECGREPRNDASVAVGIVFHAELHSPLGARKLIVDDLPFSRGKTTLYEVDE